MYLLNEGFFELESKELIKEIFTYKNNEKESYFLMKRHLHSLVSFFGKRIIPFLPFKIESFEDFSKKISLLSLEYKGIEIQEVLNMYLSSSLNTTFLFYLYDQCASLRKNFSLTSSQRYFLENTLDTFEDISKIPLKERYSSINISFIQDMTEEIYKRPLEIENIFSKYNILLEFISFSELKEADLDPEIFVCEGFIYKKSKRIGVRLSEYFYKEKIQKGLNKDCFQQELTLSLIHECTHKHQGNKKPPSVFDDYKKPSESGLDYFSQREEIDAYARSVAYDLYKNKVDISLLNFNLMKKDLKRWLSFCKDNNLSLNTSKTIILYTTLLPSKVKNMFLKKLYSFINEF